MSRRKVLVPVLLAAIASSLAGQQPKSQSKPVISVSGIFTGRSGKPMARARLVLGSVESDEQWQFSRIKLAERVAAAIADQKGRFQFKGVTPGTYTIIYHPSGATMLLPPQISIRGLSAESRSILPMMRNVEVGKSEPLPERAWGQTFTLLKGQIFWSMGANMKIWNATVRWRQQGPYMEVRKGEIWQDRFDEKTEIKFEAWSY